MGRFFIPAKGPEDWKRALADPETQWERGFSARTLAHCWHDADQFPAPIQEMITAALGSTEMLVGIPEYTVSLEGRGRSSQNDLFVLARNEAGLVTIMVEGKVAEPFDRTVAEWMKDASPGKEKRLQQLCSLLGLTEQQVQPIRYQLLHRTASALIEAKRFRAPTAVMLVHSFSPDDAWFGDFAAFAGLFGISAKRDTLALAGDFNGIKLYLGWAHGDAKYLSA